MDVGRLFGGVDGVVANVEPPVFDLQHEETARAVQEDEIGMEGFGAYGYVVPAL
jgi:hypothetical protein